MYSKILAEELELMKYKDLRNLAATALFQIKERYNSRHIHIIFLQDQDKK